MKNLNRVCEKLVRERFNENLASGRDVYSYMENSTAEKTEEPSPNASNLRKKTKKIKEKT